MSEAARRAGLSPAAIAQQMRTLERDLQVRLLVRHGRKVRPTAAGERLFERGQQLVQAYEELGSWISSGTDHGLLRLGALNTALHGFLPEMLQDFFVQNPGVEVRVLVDNTQKLYSALLHDELDAAICLHPGIELPKSICWHPLREEPLVLLCQGNDADIPVLELLHSRPLVRYERTLAGGKLAERYLQAQGIQTRSAVELNSVIAVAMMVERGLGVGVVPDIGSTLNRNYALIKRPLPPIKALQQTPTRELGVLWQQTSPRARWVRSLIECAKPGLADV